MLHGNLSTPRNQVCKIQSDICIPSLLQMYPFCQTAQQKHSITQDEQLSCLLIPNKSYKHHNGQKWKRFICLWTLKSYKVRAEDPPAVECNLKQADSILHQIDHNTLRSKRERGMSVSQQAKSESTTAPTDPTQSMCIITRFQVKHGSCN